MTQHPQIVGLFIAAAVDFDGATYRVASWRTNEHEARRYFARGFAAGATMLVGHGGKVLVST